jgi:D-xylose transport system ATP-binding protein
MGAGRTELLMHLFGAWGTRRSGSVRIDGKEIRSEKPADIIKRGLVLVSEDRRRYGLVLDHEIGFNLSLSSLDQFSRAGFINRSRETTRNRESFDSLHIKATGLTATAGKLSGGNQQKVVLGKWLACAPKVLLLDEPTRGVDVGARAQIHARLHALAAAGMAVLFVSSELDEVLALADRVLVLHQGELAADLPRAAATEHSIMLAATSMQAAVAR